MSRDEALAVTELHSVAGVLGRATLVTARPFRAPHHSVSAAGLLGGGSGIPRPGEASLAHHGVLFLDELAEFRRDALEGLRQPLEDGRIVLRRAGGAVEFPARFMLVAAANPCPCGFEGDPANVCTCSPQRTASYRAKLSGPLLDRIDLRVAVPRLTPRELLGRREGEASSAIRQRVESGRMRQRARLAPFGVACNAQLGGPAARQLVSLDAETSRMLSNAIDRLQLTGRGVDRTLKVARTIADLDGTEQVTPGALAEALSLRSVRDPEERVGAG
jgi:magnesium chelatase family protein